jgi:hypothetical protein
MRAFVLLPALLTLPFIPTAEAGRLKCQSVTASSTFRGGPGENYEAKLIGDNKLSTSWQEGASGAIGESVTCDFGAATEVKTIKLWHGLWTTYDYWQSAERPQQVELKFSDGTTQLADLNDEMVAQEVAVNKSTSSIRVRIKSNYSGTAWNDSGFSEIHFFDGSADGTVPVASYATSSQLPDDNDGNYKPENLNDGMKDSQWCEGEDGDGTNSWVEFNFKGSQSVSKLNLVNGVASSVKVFFKYNKAIKGTLQFSDGSKEEIVIKPTVMPQAISFRPRTTQKVKLTFTGVKAGSESNTDLCISEAYFGR